MSTVSRRWLALGAVLYLLLFLINAVPFVLSDGFYYFHGAKALLQQGTFAPTHRPEYDDYADYAVTYRDGKYIEVVSPGGALFLLPGLTISHALRSPQQTIYTDYFLAANGHTFLDGMVILLTATTFAAATLWLIYASLRRLQFSPRVSALATAMVYASSYAIWYVLLQPAFSHTYELFSFALYVWGLVEFQRLPKQRHVWAVAVGAALAFLLRPVFGVLVVVPGIYLLFKRQWRLVLIFAAPVAVAGIIWMLYNIASYGSPFASGYNYLRSENFGSTFNGHNLLFSLQRGWFVYSPLFLFALVGLNWLWSKHKLLVLSAVSATVSLIAIYAFWPNWWGGGSFGQRFLIPLAALLAPGVAGGLLKATKLTTSPKLIWQWAGRLLTAVLVLCTVWSVLLTGLYRITPVASLRATTTENPYGMFAPDQYTVLDMWAYHINLIRQARSIPQYLKNLYASSNGGVSLAVLAAGSADVILRLDEEAQEGQLLFRIILPPLGRQPVPESIYGYIFSPAKRVFKFQVNSLNKLTTFAIQCTLTECAAGDAGVEVEEVKNYPTEFLRSEFVGLQLRKFPFQMFVYRPPNLQIKGQPINIRAEHSSYRINLF